MPPTAAPPLLAAEGLTFTRDDEPVFGPLDLCVKAGEAVLVQGGNGAGKTTLLRVLAGLLRAEAGTVRLNGEVATADTRAAAMAFVGHLPGLKGDLTAAENLAFARGLGGGPGNTREALAAVGLPGFDDALTRQLSAGQRKRVALARLLVTPVPLWLLDEPYANLDLEGIAMVDRLVSGQVGRGGAVLLTTHGAYAAPPVRSRVLHIGGGP